MTRRRTRALRHEPTVEDLFEDGRAIDDALREAARDARTLHLANVAGTVPKTVPTGFPLASGGSRAASVTYS